MSHTITGCICVSACTWIVCDQVWEGPEGESGRDVDPAVLDAADTVVFDRSAFMRAAPTQWQSVVI